MRSLVEGGKGELFEGRSLDSRPRSLSCKVTLDVQTLPPFHAQRIADKIKDLDNDFKTHHLSIIELVDNEEVLAEEQTISDDHDDIIAEMAVAVERLLSSSESSPSEAHSIAEKATVNRRLMHLQRLVETVAERIAEIEDPADMDICLLEQLEGDVVQRKARVEHYFQRTVRTRR